MNRFSAHPIFLPPFARTAACISQRNLKLHVSWGRLISRSMILTMNIPDDLSSELNAGFQNLGRAALEALAAEAYEKDVLSLEQIRRLLELESRWEAQDVLSRHGVWPGQSAEEILSDAATSSEFRAAIQ